MKSISYPILLFCIAPAMLCLPEVNAQEARPPGDSAREALLEQAQPGPEHEELAGFTGKWSVTVTMGKGNRSATSRISL